MRQLSVFLMAAAVTVTLAYIPTTSGAEDTPAGLLPPIQIPCGDPQGCPDLTTSTWFLETALMLDTRSFEPASCAVQEYAIQPGKRRLLRMNAATINVGSGELIVGGPSNDPGRFDFDECHGHFHFLNYDELRLWLPADYAEWTALRAANPSIPSSELLDSHPDLKRRMVGAHKLHFCIGDSLYCQPELGCPVGQTIGPSMHSFADPNTCSANQGLSVGWIDAYPLFFDGQWIEAPNHGGTFVLEEEVNTTRIIEESDYTNNSASICVNIPPKGGGPFVGDPGCIDPPEFEEATTCEMCLAICDALVAAGAGQSECPCGFYCGS